MDVQVISQFCLYFFKGRETAGLSRIVQHIMLYDHYANYLISGCVRIRVGFMTGVAAAF